MSNKDKKARRGNGKDGSKDDCITEKQTENSCKDSQDDGNDGKGLPPSKHLKELRDRRKQTHATQRIILPRTRT